MTNLNKYWTLIIITFLIVIIAIGGLVFWSKYSSSQPIEISIASEQEWQGKINISGAINSPGIYPVRSVDTLQDIIQNAGGAANGADLSCLKIYLPPIGEEIQVQKIDLNRAEAWLLEALPGIGEVKAQAIIDYRCQNGSFQNINELTKVEGIGLNTYEQVKHLITVAD